jgi:hypothetical protein
VFLEHFNAFRACCFMIMCSVKLFGFIVKPVKNLI